MKHWWNDESWNFVGRRPTYRVFCTHIGTMLSGEEKVLSLTSSNCIPSFLPSLKKWTFPILWHWRERLRWMSKFELSAHFHTWDFKTKRRDRQIKNLINKDTDQTDLANTPTWGRVRRSRTGEGWGRDKTPWQNWTHKSTIPLMMRIHLRWIAMKRYG